ncbi:major facilitator superfamily transporter multidrug resistance [Colletotrichum chrysophilum]|uniref:Major facilitator superfamily transporter multidrug resistance n=1 Tax=Colletotrichum chrysophilum TaxID=1836956 RepID=A0AAD9AH61_9PEZI|nr:major facilitator superfamily transporter multidrug resistance [Colletotrichum chrysophilum]
MARITDLPPEIIESILWSLDSVRSLIAALRSCRRFYAFVQQSEKIATGILRRKISPAILPYVAALEASYLCDDFPDVILKLIEPRHDDPDAPSGESDESNSESEVELEDFEEPLNDIEGSLDEFDDFDTESSDSFPGRRAFKFDCFLAARKLLKMLYDQPSALVDIILPPVPIFDLHVVERRYDKFSKIATDFAGFAWERLSEIDGGVPQEVTLSSAEHDRFCRAIYRLEIFYVLYNIMERNGNTVYDWFFLRHSPWENEQMACIYHFLEMRFTRNTHEVFAHDVGFGKRKVDYLRLWTKNKSRQLWLSQGIEYIDDVTMQHDYESKKRMLETTDGVHYAHFPEVLCGIEPQMFSIDYWRRSWRMTFADGATIITTKEGVLSRVLREEDKDHDLGPRESWIAANLGMRKCVSLLMDGNDWLRECAYLFWDWDRVRRYQLSGLWQHAPVRMPYTKCGANIKEMKESFVERSKIWDEGGRGYWSKGDTSRIVWPESEAMEQASGS